VLALAVAAKLVAVLVVELLHQDNLPVEALASNLD
jgi:hypothetical protein